MRWGLINEVMVYEVFIDGGPQVIILPKFCDMYIKLAPEPATPASNIQQAAGIWSNLNTKES
jgi:hypothetical protein